MPRQATSSDQPTGNNRSASSAARFAMNVDFATQLNLHFDEFYGFFNIRQRRVRKVYCRHAKLANAEFLVSGDRPGVFFASIDDRRNAAASQTWDVSPKRERAEHDGGVNFVPPASMF